MLVDRQGTQSALTVSSHSPAGVTAPGATEMAWENLAPEPCCINGPLHRKLYNTLMRHRTMFDKFVLS